MNKRITVSVIGDSGVAPGSTLWLKAERLGRILIDNNYYIINGGMSGIMEACFIGAKQSEHYREGMTIAVIPAFDPSLANTYADIVIPTGLDTYRNAIVANADVVVALGGGAGTLSEMAFAWIFKRMIIAYDVSGWSGKLADSRIDDRKRIEWEGDKVFKVTKEDEVPYLINKYLHHYEQRHYSIVSAYRNKGKHTS